MYGTSEKSSRLGKIPVLRMGNINREGGLDWKDLVYSNNEEDIEKFNLLHNDLLFNRTNSSEWVGKTAIYKGERPAIYAGYIIRLRTIFVNADYINFVMNSQYHRNWCNDVKTDAVNQSNINAQKLSVFRVPLPPIEEQNRIVKEIKRWLSLIKVIKSGKENLQESIKQTKSKVLDLAIHGKLVPQDPNEEPAIELLKRINPKAEIITDNGHYQKLPEGWCMTALCNISTILNGYAFKSSEYVSSDGIRIIRIANVQDGYIEDKLPQYYPKTKSSNIGQFLLKYNDLLMSLTGNVGRVGMLPKSLLPAALNQRVACIRENNLAVNKYYLFYLFQSNNFCSECIKSAKGVAQLNISTEWLKSYSILLPPITEQKRIVGKIEEIFAQLDAIETAL